MASANSARAKLNQHFVSGWIEIFAAPKALLAHVEWSLERALDCKLQITWSTQPLTPGSFQTRLRFSAPSGRAGEIATALATKVWPMLEAGKAGPRIFQTFPLAEAASAHRLMESSAHIGKIMLKVAD